MKWLLALMMLTSVADLASTEIALGKGYVELNPVMENQGVRIASHLLVPVAIFHMTKKMSKKRRVFWCVVAGSIWASVAARNFYIVYTFPIGG